MIEKSKSVGERLLALRNMYGLTQEDLAEQLNVSRQSISKWELNKTLPDVEKLIQLSEMYQVSIDFLIKGEEDNIDEQIQDGELKEWENAGAEKGQIQQQADGEGEQEGIVGKDTGGVKVYSARQGVLLICILLSGLLCLYMIYVTGRMFVKHTFRWEDREQNLACVEKIYEQYTKAQVVVRSADNKEFLKEIVWLDIPGVRENDYIFCYLDGENVNQVTFEYYTKTLLLPVIAGIIFLIFLIVFVMEFKELGKRNRSISKREPGKRG